MLTAVIAGLVFALQALGLSSIIHEQIWPIVIFSAVIGVLVLGITIYFMRNGAQMGMVSIFMASTALRMILSIIFITVVFFQGLENQLVWISDFFAVYLFYLVFEIYTIMSNLRAISNEGEKK